MTTPWNRWRRQSATDWRQLSFQSVLLVSMLAVGLGGISILTMIGARIHRQSLHEAADALTRQLLNRATYRVDELIRSAIQFETLSQVLLGDRNLTSESFRRLARQYGMALESHPHLQQIRLLLPTTGEELQVIRRPGEPVLARLSMFNATHEPIIRELEISADHCKFLREIPWERSENGVSDDHSLGDKWITKVLETKGSLWTEVTHGQTVATLLSVREVPDSAISVLSIDLDLQAVQAMLNEVVGELSENVMVITEDDHGQFLPIATSFPKYATDKFAYCSEFASRLRESMATDDIARESGMRTLDVQHTRWQAVSRTLSGPLRPNWTVVVAWPANAREVALFADRQFMIATSSIALLATLTIWGVARWISQPLKRLEQQAIRLAAGDDPLPAPRVNLREIDQLNAALVSLASQARERLRTLERTNDELNSSRRRLQLHIDRTPVGAMDLDKEGRVIAWNPACETIFGWKAEEVLGRHFAFIIPQELRPEIDQVVSELWARRGGFRHDNVNLTKDGRIIDCEWYNTPMIDADGEVNGIACLVLDVTQRIADEERIRRFNVELEQQIEARTSELKLANRDLEAFSYSVAHDLRAPLRAINAFSQALIEDLGPGPHPNIQDHVDRIRTASQRMAGLIDSLLALARVVRQEVSQESVDLSEFAKAALQRLQQADPSRQTEISIEPHQLARGDRNLLRTLMENLLENAWKYTQKKDVARISFGRSMYGDEMAFFVRDNGVGFDPRYSHKLFQPFERLHHSSEYEGHGIGLATVRRIVEKHGGRVWIDGVPGEGACAWFTLPAVVPESPTAIGM